MKRWMHTSPIRALGMLAALSLMLAACDPQALMQLLDAQPIAQEAPAAAKADGDAAGADDTADTTDEQAAEADEADADGAKAEHRSKDADAQRTGRRQRREGPGTTADEPSAPAPTRQSGGDGGHDSAGSGGGGSADLSNVEQAIYDRLNSTRRGAGLEALTLSAKISTGARSWSCQMAQSGNFRHADLGSAGVSGENIAWGQQGAAAVHDAWMTSPGHRDNRMSSRWSEYGVGVCNDSNGRPYYTERFR